MRKLVVKSMSWLIKSNDDNNDKNKTSSSNKENYEISNDNNDKEYVRGNDSYNERIR